LIGSLLQELVAGAVIGIIAADAVVFIAFGAVEDLVERVLDLFALDAGFAGNLVETVLAGFARHQPTAPTRHAAPSLMIFERVSASSLSWFITSWTSARSCSVKVGSSLRQTSSASAAAVSSAVNERSGTSESGSGTRSAASDSASVSGSL
jgi:hypothetical protein